MKLWLDCEFNGFGGELISIALVDENKEYFYEYLECTNPVDWVKEHVIPILNIELFFSRGSISIGEMQYKLQSFLMGYDSIHIIADWPEDISYFCKLLIVSPGTRLNTPPLTLEIVRIDSESEVPHNALYDAFGIQQKCKELEHG